MSQLEDKIYRIASGIDRIVSNITTEKFWITHYGAFDIDPKYLVYKIVVQTDDERGRLLRDEDLKIRLRQLLDDNDYPQKARGNVSFGFDSDESINRDSGGNAWHHWR